MSRIGLALLAVVSLALAAHAAGRARYGGTLRVVIAGKMAEADPLHADAPLEATLISLVAQPLCRLDGHLRTEPALATDFTSPTPSTLEVKLAVAPRADGKPLSSTDAAQALRRALTEATPYRGLLLPLADGASVVESGPDRLTLRLAFPWPDLERSLCHPAMALSRSPRTDGAGPFVVAGSAGSYLPQRAFPRGRPFVDTLVISGSDVRGATRLLAQRKAQLALGIPTDAPPPPMLSATYLLWAPDRAGPEVRAALEKAVDRDDLTRYWVRAPSAPMTGLLPPLLMPENASSAARPAPPSGGQKALTLAWDASNDDHRAVAERLQVRLQSLGYRVKLEPVPRRTLREAWRGGEFTLMLQQVLLPPVPAAALAVVATLARAPDAAARLRPLGQVADPKDRGDKARALAAELLPQLNLLPIYAQGLSLQSSPQVQQLSLDGFGLPRLDDVFLSGEAP